MLVSLSARLDAVLSLLEPCAVLADVGTDHALLPIAAVQRERVQRAFAADLRPLPLEVARRNVERAGERERVTLRQSDGLRGFEGVSLDAVTMAGVSGALMVRVLASAPRVVAGLSQLVLQPNQDVDAVRAWARDQGFHLRAERMIEERDYYFPVCAFERREGPDPRYASDGFTVEELCLLGPLLLAQKDRTALRAFDEQRLRLDKLVRDGVHSRARELAVYQRACDFLAT
ncbi:MAG: hypothetical protein JWN48_3755 [Myxococcaceae bacterium]|nr:hypothetical protein [Myxococcaceae bacterium]